MVSRIIVSCCFIIGCISLQAYVRPYWPKELFPDTAVVQKDTVTVIGVGDIMMGTNYPDDSQLPPQDGLHLMSSIDFVLKDADVTMGNLEGVLLDEGGVAKTCRNPKVCYVFRSPQRYVQNLVNSGFDVLSIANNHAGDFGAAGTSSTMSTLEKAGLHFAGQESRPYTIFEKNSVRYGFIAFAPNAGCANINDIPAAQAMVKRLDSLCDVVIVSFHGGAEGPDHQHVLRSFELFYGENRGDVYHFAHAMIDAGADIIFGHGPHVVRAAEVYNDRFIAYSLGNFCTYGGINISGINGLAPIMKVYTDRHGVFLQAKIIACVQVPFAGVQADPKNQVIQKITELSERDFPQGLITINENGWIRKSTK
jgi:Bacterial capsule synthesis protein PGA_cap